jgi:protein-tyrosine phosphatase
LAHRARQFQPDWFAARDVILAMDSGHLRDLRDLAGRAGAPADHVRLIREFDPAGPGDIPDPYYDTIVEFREVRRILERTMPSLLDHLRTLMDQP